MNGATAGLQVLNGTHPREKPQRNSRAVLHDLPVAFFVPVKSHMATSIYSRSRRAKDASRYKHFPFLGPPMPIKQMLRWAPKEGYVDSAYLLP
jgi:hypothetical protein